MHSSKKLKKLLKKANKFLKYGNFDEALRLYVFIEKHSNEIDNEKLRQSYQIYKDSMILFILMKESLVLANKNEMDLLKEKLDYIHNHKRDLEFALKSTKLTEFIENNYHYCLGIYIYNFYKKLFLKEFEDIHYYMNAGWVDKATERYNKRLLRYYSKLIKYGDHRVRDTLYKAITKLYSEIKLTDLKQKAYSEFATYSFKNIKSKTKKEKIEIQPRKLNKVEIMSFDKKKFKKLHELIKNNNSEEALNLYKSL